MHWGRSGRGWSAHTKKYDRYGKNSGSGKSHENNEKGEIIKDRGTRIIMLRTDCMKYVQRMSSKGGRGAKGSG